jgi:hypothetical protein
MVVSGGYGCSGESWQLVRGRNYVGDKAGEVFYPGRAGSHG